MVTEIRKNDVPVQYDAYQKVCKKQHEKNEVKNYVNSKFSTFQTKNKQNRRINRSALEKNNKNNY